MFRRCLAGLCVLQVQARTWAAAGRLKAARAVPHSHAARHVDLSTARHEQAAATAAAAEQRRKRIFRIVMIAKKGTIAGQGASLPPPCPGPSAQRPCLSFPIPLHPEPHCPVPLPACGLHTLAPPGSHCPAPLPANRPLPPCPLCMAHYPPPSPLLSILQTPLPV